eukprot:1619926-Amphidinium_carterae.3
MAVSAAADSGCGAELHATGGVLVLGQDRVPIARSRGVYELTARLVHGGAGCSGGTGVTLGEELDPFNLERAPKELRLTRKPTEEEQTRHRLAGHQPHKAWCSFWQTSACRAEERCTATQKAAPAPTCRSWRWISFTWDKGGAYPNCFFHEEWGVRLTYHSDDIGALGEAENLDKLEAVIGLRFQVVRKARLGRGAADDKEALLLNRILSVTADRILIEPDPRHAWLVIAALGLLGVKS